MLARNIPNLITVLRMVSVVPLVWLLMEQHYLGALVVAFLAGLSDAVDGFLAKRYGWISRLGGILDPLADKLLLICCYIVLAMQGHLAVWLVVLVLGRDVVIVTGGTLFHHLIKPVDADPTLVSKLNTLLQILLVLLVLLHLAYHIIHPQWVDVGTVAVAATTLVSGLNYVWIWGRRAWLHRADTG